MRAHPSAGFPRRQIAVGTGWGVARAHRQGGVLLRVRGMIGSGAATCKRYIVQAHTIAIDDDNQQYYMKVDYPTGRTDYLSGDSDPLELRELLDYMIQSDWNFPGIRIQFQI